MRAQARRCLCAVPSAAFLEAHEGLHRQLKMLRGQIKWLRELGVTSYVEDKGKRDLSGVGKAGASEDLSHYGCLRSKLSPTA